MDKSLKIHKGMKGKITKEIVIIDVQTTEIGTDIRVQEDSGDEYWTRYDEKITID